MWFNVEICVRLMNGAMNKRVLNRILQIFEIWKWFLQSETKLQLPFQCPKQERHDIEVVSVGDVDLNKWKVSTFHSHWILFTGD